jgi:ketosteroid isomerase-like protein
MTIKEIANAFSNGEFDKVTDLIEEDAVWEVIEENTFVGRQAIVENCNQVAGYFSSVTTDFKTLHVIAENNMVVVNGTAAFFRNNKKVSFVSACDLYTFTDTNKIQKITSYCIQAK